MGKNNHTNSASTKSIVKPGYKHTPLGWIPEEWDVKEIGDIADLASGTTPSRQNHTKYFENGTIPWVKTTDLNNSEILKTEELVTTEALNETSLKVLPENTILVAMYGGFNQIGRTGLLRHPATINQALTAIKLKNGDNPKYILEWLNFKVTYWKNFAGSSRKDPNITGKDVADFPVFIPSIQEQNKIASILQVWDEAIQKTQQLIEKLKLRNKGLMQELLTGRRRLRGYTSEWKKVELSQTLEYEQPQKYLTEAIGTNGDENNIPVLTANKSFILGYTSDKINIYSDIPVIIFDDFTTASRYIDFKFKIKSSAIKLLSPKYGFNLRFLHERLQLIETNIAEHKRRWISEYEPKVIVLPDEDEQKSIGFVAALAAEEIQFYEQKLAILERQKKGLMQQLLTGEIRANNII